ncbi:type I toxin-antitoxin system SymE family toxin [Spirosoma sp. RP8]|uniref:Type I toxin-antitoxin system SymE family toxin n=2 Tax=Spirosoma liriopis TaxID=2937440 RepID=A0ABT0HVG6_9BACT|nr:SymE family type I addiction module toxin [Spirosoma liriopis]MCK8495847.1 type I toxin-antitoxin system SymE family toxin [Spirosoma liriopis]
MSVSPSLELSGNWFKAAGFAPGQLVSVETQDGVITIRAAR